MQLDRLTQEHRSWNMSRIKAKDTKPEIAVRSMLHSLGYRFRLHSNLLPGKPDIVLPKYRTAIFVHGCFWHRHHDCRLTYNPKSRCEFWQAKFNATVARDVAVCTQLKNLGWKVLVVWECEVHDNADLASRLKSCLQLPDKSSVGAGYTM